MYELNETFSYLLVFSLAIFLIIGVMLLFNITYFTDKQSQQSIVDKMLGVNISILKSKDDYIKYVDKYLNFNFYLTSKTDRDEVYIQDTLRKISQLFDNPGSRQKIKFHGACINCISPQYIGIYRCKKCRYVISHLNDLCIPDESDLSTYAELPSC
jgi:hypothetical protein